MFHFKLLTYFLLFEMLLHDQILMVSAKIVMHNEEEEGLSNLVSFNDRQSKLMHDTTDWSTWSNWSECSKTCDGGATFQYRQCKEQKYCHGPKIRYKLCNTQPCSSDTVDFRVQQCSAYNNIALKGQLYRWVPHINVKKACALTCRSEEEGILKELAPKVLDGTRCRDGSLDMCINGVCMPVGCDLTLGSRLKLDACGVCGGDGSLCGRASAYRWQQGNYSQCSRSCGGGHQSATVLCFDTRIDAIVEEVFCDATLRPVVQMHQCNKHLCNPTTTKYKATKGHTSSSAGNHQWTADGWGPCTSECNGGSQARRVYCLHLLLNGTKHIVGDFHCTKHTQPATERRCNNHACPQWQTSSWSACSATCGRGTQVRTVKCVDHKGFDNDMQCDKTIRPSDRKVCKVSSYCPMDSRPSSTTKSYTLLNPNDPFDLPHSEQALPLVAPNPYQWNEQMDVDEALKYEDTPMFAIGTWSECSAPCGHGYRYRSVECKLYIKFSVKLVQLPDSECSDTRPVDREPCTRRPCEDTSNSTAKPYWFKGNQSSIIGMDDIDDSNEPRLGNGMGIDVTYSWHYQGYTTCTRTCLGGVRHAVIQCFRDHDQSPVDEKYCKNIRRPPELKQICNDVPCPPRWNTSDFTACSHTCGGGVQTRTVQCVQELGADPADLLTMPMDSCAYPPPRTQVVCNPVDCLAKWDAGQWGSCSRTCGKGIMERTVVCRQRMASGDVRDIVEQPQLVCPHPKISSMKSCHLQACSGENKAWSTKPPMEDTDGKPAPVTLNVSRGKAKANKLKVGGSAVLHEGTALRLKCPVFVLPGHPRPLVKWLKDGRPLTFSKRQKAHFKESALGAVKIKSLRKADAGTYTCIAGRIRETIDLTVISRLSVTKPLNFLANDQHTSSRPLFIGSNSNTIQRFYANSTDALRILQTVSQKTTQTPFTSNALLEEDVRVTKDHGKPVEDFEDRTSPEQLQYTVKPTEIVNNDKSQVDLDIAVSMALNAFQRSENDQKEFLHGKADISQDGKRILLRSRSGGSRLAIEWKIAEWSSCSKSCGGDGSQVRSVDCHIQLDKDKLTTTHRICISAGLSHPPDTLRSCGWAECPQWTTDSWEECEKSECFALDTAVQTRNVTCAFSNGSQVPLEICSSDAKPRDKRDCVNYKCKAVWTTGPWSECTVSCGRNGIRSRILKCVWYGSSRPAGNMCRSLERPPVKESCQETAKCPAEPPCRDHFKYCDYANSLKLCKQKAYRLRCCRTCSTHPSVR